MSEPRSAALDVLQAAAAAGVRVWVQEGKLKVSAPKEGVPDGILQSLREVREDLLTLLQGASSTQDASVEDGFDPADQALLEAPGRVAQRLLSATRPVRSPAGHWVLVRHADVTAALHEDRLVNTPAQHSWLQARGDGDTLCVEVANRIIPFMEGPRHRDLRRFLAQQFTKCLQDPEPGFERVLRALGLPRRGPDTVDLVADVGRPYAATLICELLGLPLDARTKVEFWGDEFLRLLTGVGSVEARIPLEENIRAFRLFCAAEVDRQIDGPKAGFIGRLIEEGLAARRITRDEIIDAVMLFAADGIENVASAVGTLAMDALAHAALFDRAVADPSVRADFVRESLRLSAPGQYIARVAAQDLEIGRTRVRRNESVLLMLGLANRDPEAFPEPDEFRIGRDPRVKALTFGRGRHHCLGTKLVSSALEAFIPLMPELLPHARLAQAQPRWRDRPGHRWLEGCPMAVGAQN